MAGELQEGVLLEVEEIIQGTPNIQETVDVDIGDVDWNFGVTYELRRDSIIVMLSVFSYNVLIVT